jgi:hypothetical protein
MLPRTPDRVLASPLSQANLPRSFQPGNKVAFPPNRTTTKDCDLSHQGLDKGWPRLPLQHAKLSPAKDAKAILAFRIVAVVIYRDVKFLAAMRTGNFA